MYKKLATLACIVLSTGFAHAQQLKSYPDNITAPTPTIHVDEWTAAKVQHAYGLPDTKPKAKGTFLVNETGLTFTSKTSRYVIPWSDTMAVSNGVERVELWGTTGRLVRMAIPNGGGLMAAGVMHHKVNEITIEFRDHRGAYHGAVFLLPGSDANRLLETSRHAVVPPAPNSTATAAVDSPSVPVCGSSLPTHSVLIPPPTWGRTEVPAAYRAMVYEHIVDRMSRVEGMTHVYRDGETGSQPQCPRYTVSVSVVSFKPGNQVQRAMTGPIGFFAGTTQMAFNVTIRDISGKLNATEQVKATVRGEGESKNITDGVAKKIAKSYARTVKEYERTTLVAGANRPMPH